MRMTLLAGVFGAGCVVCIASSPQAYAAESWTYHDCVQSCRDDQPPGKTLQQCIIDKVCTQYPRPARTYQQCVKRCEDEIKETSQSLQQCVARYVCSQFPGE